MKNVNRNQGVKPVTTESPAEFARRLGLPFKSYLLLIRALTHRSYLNEHSDAIEDNERLEFLGDAVLDYQVGYLLYNRFPEMKEGELTRLRSLLVDTKQLAHFARQIKLGAVIRMGKGEEENGGRERDSVLCGAFEALIGAIQLEKGAKAVSQFTVPLLEPAINEILSKNEDKDAKSLLQEWSQGGGHGVPEYRIVGVEGPDHDKIFTTEVYIGEKCMGVGKGHSKQKASKNAAQKALESLTLNH